MRSSTMMMLAVMGAIGGPIGAVAQTDSTPPPRHEPGLTAPVGGDQAAEHLRQRLETIDAERARINEAIRRLDAGEPWDRVSAELRERGGQGMARPNRNGADHDIAGRGGPNPDGPRTLDRGQRKMDVGRLLELFREVDPESFRQLESMRERNPRMARRLLRASGPRLMELARLRDSNPALFKVEAEQFRIEHRIMQTARAMHQAIAGPGEGAPDVSIDAARDLLRELVARQVDLQIQGQQIQLESAQGRLEHLRLSIEKHVESREALIAERVDRILERAVRSGVDRRQRDDAPRPQDRGQRRKPGRP